MRQETGASTQPSFSNQDWDSGEGGFLNNKLCQSVCRLQTLSLRQKFLDPPSILNREVGTTKSIWDQSSLYPRLCAPMTRVINPTPIQRPCSGSTVCTWSVNNLKGTLANPSCNQVLCGDSKPRPGSDAFPKLWECELYILESRGKYSLFAKWGWQHVSQKITINFQEKRKCGLYW